MPSNSKTKKLLLLVFLIALITGFIAGMFGAGVYSYLIKEQALTPIEASE